MKIRIKSIAFLITGVYALIGIYIAKQLIFLYHNGENGINLLPIDYFEILLFILAILIVIASMLTFYILTKKSKIKISRKFKMQLLISILVGSIILFLVAQNGFNQLLIPIASVIFGVILLNLNRHVKSNLFYFAFAELLIGIIAFVINNNDWLFLNLTFGVLPMLYGVIHLKKE